MFKPRLISCIILLAIFLTSFLVKGYFGLLVFLITGTFVSILCVHELSSLLERIGFGTFTKATALFAAIFFIGIILTNIYSIHLNVILLTGGIFGIYCWVQLLLSNNRKESLIKVVASSAVFIMIVIPLNCLTMIYVNGYFESYIGVNLILLLILVTKAGDVGSYVVGTLTARSSSGNHKIVPSISPKKSWEGVIGGVIFSLITAYILLNMIDLPKIYPLVQQHQNNHLIPHNIIEYSTKYFNYRISPSWWLSCLLGLLLFVGGFIGDIAESALKRITNIKDSGSIIPGIGGVLDLIDSLLINAPLFYLTLKLFNMI